MGDVMTGTDRLGPDHVCRRDDPGYSSVGEWYEAHQGRVPIQAAAALSRLVRERNMSFSDAFRSLIDAGALILIEGEAEDEAVHSVTIDLAGNGELDSEPLEE
jgi:hypothetical protein